MIAKSTPLIVSLLISTAAGLARADEPSPSEASFRAVLDFVESNLIGKTLETRVGSKITYGSLETEDVVGLFRIPTQFMIQ